MTTELTRIEVNCETGETTIVPLTSEEIAELQKVSEQYSIQQAEIKARIEAEEAVKASAIAKLAALGLTEEEAKALVK